MNPYRILLVDDHTMFRLGLKRIIERNANLEVIGEAGDGLELLRLLRRNKPDMVVLDISMPSLGGIEAVHEVKAIDPDISVLILTVHREMEFVSAAVAAGARGYLLKEDSDRQLFSAIEKIRQGGIYLSPKLTDQVMSEWTETCRQNSKPATGIHPLTVREREVLKLTAEGKSAKEIADLLNISCRTVEHHRTHIMAKLKLKGTAELVNYAISKGILDPIHDRASRTVLGCIAFCVSLIPACSGWVWEGLLKNWLV
jgi:two-component system, NarL family, response regulator NreC